MEKKCNFRKGFFAVLVAASAVVGCSKSNNDEPVTPPTPTDPASYYIELTTEKAVGEKIKLDVGTDKADEAGVWLDLNGNGKWDEGIDQKPKIFNNFTSFLLQAQTFKIYGKIGFLNCSDEEITALDISHNPALIDLDAINNKLPSIAHLEHLERLAIDSHTLKNSQLPQGLTYLNVNETTPLTTINTSSFTKLQTLIVSECKSIKSLDLSNNKKLQRLFVDNTGLTTLDLSHQPELESLYASFTPLTKLNVAGNKALNKVKIKLTYEGKGLQGEALMDFLKQLPTREKGKEGSIYLSPAQATEGVKGYLGSKFWSVD